MPARQLSLFENILGRLPRFRRKKLRLKPPRRGPARGEHRKADDPNLKALWLQIRRQHFPDRPDIDDYSVYWSKRKQIRTLASCNLEQKRISVAKELNYPEHSKWLNPLLYHEMCHAYLGFSVAARHKGERGRWHGKEFQDLEANHPGVEALDQWIKDGGWLTAVRSARAKEAHAKRRKTAA